ncbi:MAG: putative ABC transporter permease [Clostridiales bacterium]|nr:putative ABC transporter permease [Clostridiales bacterium]
MKITYFYELAILFYTYSFLGWLAETTVATIKEKDFRNRGFASGPFCFLYGLTGVVLTVFLYELKDNATFLFLGCTAVATAMEWFAGKILERLKHKKWWDYSAKKWNFDGYICLQYSILWGILGFLALRYGNGVILGIYHSLPSIAGQALIWALTAVGAVDLLGSFMLVSHMEERLPRLLSWNHKLQRLTFMLASKLSGRIERRIGRSYPSVLIEPETEKDKNGDRCGAVQVFWLFMFGALAGDIVETLFCRVTTGAWMSRSSLVWGPFSVVWGLAIAIVTVLLYRDKDKQEHRIFFVGVLLGGAYEYICSVFTELIFGKVFWDYSSMPFNLGGRINLLYCLFWGIAGVVWIKGLYPKVERLISILLEKTGRWLTGIMMVFMTVNIVVSMMALIRYDSRADGKAAAHGWERVIDERFGDERMERIYPNAISR